MSELRKMLRGLKKRIKGLSGYREFTAEKDYILPKDHKQRFLNKTVVVTGGAGGIGRAISLRFATEGAIVYVAGRDVGKIRRVLEEIHSLGGNGKELELDVCSDESISAAFQKVDGAEGQIDFLVNCAGGSPRERATYFHMQEIAVIDEMLNTNLRGSMLCSRMAAYYMIGRKYGKIINIASVLGTNGQIKQTEYTAAKAGIIGYTKALAMELGKYGITVNCVSPGLVSRGKFDSDTAIDLCSKNWLHRMGTQEQIAEAAAFLASDEADFITGQNLMVDGGWSLGVKGEQ